MDNGFNRVDADLREVRSEMRAMRSEANTRFEAIDARFDSLRASCSGRDPCPFLTVGAAIVATQL